MSLTIATLADYADALLHTRRAKNVLVGIVLAVLVFQVTVFFCARYKFDPKWVGSTAAPATMPTAERVVRVLEIKYWVEISDFAGVVATIVLAIDLLLAAGVMLVGRLIGVSRMIKAFLWTVFLATLLFPWQAFLNNETLTSTDFKVPGILYNWAELSARARFVPEHFWTAGFLFWTRFAAMPIVAIVILLCIESSARGAVRLATGGSTASIPTPPRIS